MLRPLFLLLLGLLAPSGVVAQTPSVVASIPPVGALVQVLVGEDAEVAVLLGDTASTHHTSLRPSQLRLIGGAGLIAQIGGTLEPWLDRVEEPPGSRRIILSQIPGTALLPVRRHGVLDGGDDNHEHSDGIDPHMWLDPDNLALWLPVLTDALVALDPDNAADYTQRRDAAVAQIGQIGAEVTERLKVLDGVTLVFAHDAFQYFEKRFGLHVAGVLSGTDGMAPGAASLSKLASAVDGTPVCVIHDATHSSKLAKSVFPNAVHVTFDPMGHDIAMDASWLSVFYGNLTEALEGCVK